jgi:hypothetical protein
MCGCGDDRFFINGAQRSMVKPDPMADFTSKTSGLGRISTHDQNMFRTRCCWSERTAYSAWYSSFSTNKIAGGMTEENRVSPILSHSNYRSVER